MTDLAQLADWLDRYIAAWRSNDANQIRALFTDDAVYRWHPWETHEAARGAEAIASAWLKEPDDPGSWEIDCEPLAVNGELGVARCETRYFPTADEPERLYHNIFLVQLSDDGRCRDFTEYYMKDPGTPSDG